MNVNALKKTANEVRKGIIESTYNAKCGHPGGSLSCADIITYLYFAKMNIKVDEPKWDKRDRFVLSKGHCAPALYAVLAEVGFIPKEDLKTLRKINSYLQGHPDMNKVPGVDMSTGSLGQGISAAAGMALSSKISDNKFNVYTVLGDGEISEGQVWEALLFASAKGLSNLCVIVDNNDLQIDGRLSEVNSPYPLKEKFEAFGFNTVEIDGHDFYDIEKALNNFSECNTKPTAIIAKTIKGKGVSFMEDVCGWHGKAPNEEQYKLAMAELEGVEL
ncbi:MAG: transketolase [Ruminococcaceae bacterium]|nr:transketolase [Oscillospiraceae bacterium]